MKKNFLIFYSLILLGIFIAIIILFINLAEGIFIDDYIVLIDHVILDLIKNYLSNPILKPVMLFFTHLGSYIAYIILSPFFIFYLWKKGKKRELYVLIMCLVGAALFNIILKSFFERTRPDLLNFISPAGYSFPSGHAMVSFSFYGYVSYISKNFIHSWFKWMLFTIIAIAIAVIIGISRIYLGVHFPSDIIAGFLAGCAWLIICIIVLEWLRFLKIIK